MAGGWLPLTRMLTRQLLQKLLAWRCGLLVRGWHPAAFLQTCPRLLQEQSRTGLPCQHSAGHTPSHRQRRLPTPARTLSHIPAEELAAVRLCCCTCCCQRWQLFPPNFLQPGEPRQRRGCQTQASASLPVEACRLCWVLVGADAALCQSAVHTVQHWQQQLLQPRVVAAGAQG